MRTLTEVIQAVSANSDAGLTEAAATKSREQFGTNALTPLPRESLWKKFIEKFDEPIIKILLAAALLSMIVDLFKANPMIGGGSLGVVVALIVGALILRQGHWAPRMMFLSALALFAVGVAEGHYLVEGLAVMIAVILATGVAFASEYKSDREFETLNASKESIQVKVRREGQLRRLGVNEVVVGDLVLLEAGDEIPADGRLAKANELSIDQSLMTGESEPTAKQPTPADNADDGFDHPGCLYRGTQVVDGVAQLIVTEVGDQTYLGRLARSLGGHADPDAGDASRVRSKLTISKELTPLQHKLKRLAEIISNVGYAAAALIFIAQLVRGLVLGEIFWPTAWEDAGRVFGELLGYFMTMVIIVVVAVPEGLPMSVTLSLALAMRKMTRANSLVRQLVACETIGSATVICTDKTGTLTQNKMRVDRIGIGARTWDREAADWPRPKADDPRAPVDWMALIGAVNSTANLETKQGKTITVGNFTEGALLHWLREGDIEYGELRLRFSALYQIHFSSERKRMTTVIRDGDQLTALVKGAPEAILESCVRYLDADGTTKDLNEETRKNMQGHLKAAAGAAMRTLAFAYAPLPPETPKDGGALHAVRDSLDQELVYIGFVGIRDPLREDVKDAVAECRDAGIDVKMITGDNVETARAIGCEIGLVAIDAPIDLPSAPVMTSQFLNSLNDEELKQALPKLRIVARAKPLDKYRLVKLLQELGEVVAVTGDGTNDAPALKKADVGLAMGITGTEVSKEASKIVLLDDAFSTIVHAVHWGRSLYENIQRFLQFQLTINVSALAITFLGVLLGVKAPFTVLQLLWINVIMDTFASIALCSEPPRPEVMKLPPKKRDDNIITPAMTTSIFMTAAFFVVVMLGLLLAIKQGYVAEGQVLRQGTLFFSVYVFFQVWNQINARSLTPQMSAFEGLGSNLAFLVIAAVVAVGQVVIVTFGGSVFNVQPLVILDWLAVIGGTTSVLIFAELVRRTRKVLGAA